ncbi:MAG: ATP-binding protein, partial [Trebonia sp.]
MPRARCDVEYNGFAVTRARAFARDTLRVWHLDGICLEAEMVTTELVTNAVLHGEPPISLELVYHDDLLRIAVADYSSAPPVPGRPQPDAMTGRGLALVAAVSAQWGVVPPHGSASGKQVWAEFSTVPRTDDEVVGALAFGVEEMLEHWADTASEADEERYEIVLGDVATDLLLAAKAHVDNIVRELTLASYESTDAEAAHPVGQLRGQLSELVRDVVIGFAEARQSIKRQALAAAARGDERTRLT